MSKVTRTRWVRTPWVALGPISQSFALSLDLKVCGSSRRGLGVNEGVMSTVEKQMAAFADSDDAGVCGVLSSWAEREFAEYEEWALGGLRQGEAEGVNLSALAHEISDLPSNSGEVYGFDRGVSRELVGASSAARSLRRAFRATSFGKPRLHKGDCSARTNVGTILNRGKGEIRHRLLREAGTGRVNFLDLRDQQEGIENQYLPLDRKRRGRSGVVMLRRRFERVRSSDHSDVDGVRKGGERKVFLISRRRNRIKAGLCHSAPGLGSNLALPLAACPWVEPAEESEAISAKQCLVQASEEGDSR